MRMAMLGKGELTGLGRKARVGRLCPQRPVPKPPDPEPRKQRKRGEVGRHLD